MAKSKNHTAHNQTNKWHRNGIHKVQRQRYSSTRGVRFSLSFRRILLQVYQKFLKNQKYARKYNNVKGGRAAAEAK